MKKQGIEHLFAEKVIKKHTEFTYLQIMFTNNTCLFRKNAV